MHQDFKFIVNLTKGYKAEDGRLFVEGIASGTDLDLTGERMSPDAIKSMAESPQQGIVEFRSEHASDWDSMLGEVASLTVTDDNQLQYKAELDPGYSKSHDLLHALVRGKKLGVSIGGQVIKAGMEWVEELQRSVYTYFDIALKEISVTAQPAYAQTWVSTITKSLDRNSIVMPQPEDLKNTQAETPEEPVNKPEDTDVPTQPEDAPREAASQADEAPADPEVEKTEEELQPTVDPSDEEAETPEPDQDPAADEAAQEETQTDQPEANADEAGDQEADAPDAPSDPAAPAADKPADSAEQVEALNKSLHATTDALDAVQKSLADTTKQLQESQAHAADLQKSLDERTAAFATIEATLKKKEDELTAAKARKTFVFSPFGTDEWQDKPAPKETRKSVRDAWLDSQGVTTERNAQAA